MFGYIVVNKPELKFKEYDVYHGYYCGLCQTLKEKFGYKGQIALNYDLTFVALLLSELYEVKTCKELSRCAVHPLKKYEKYFNECIDYASQMTIVLTYLKCEDDWLDDRKKSRYLYQKCLKRSYQDIKNQYPQKLKAIEVALEQIHLLEKQECYDIDQVAGCFGRVMGEICVYLDDEWKDDLYEMGFYLGKFIYLLDAYDDIEDDMSKHRYNPLMIYYQKEDFDDRCYQLLEMMIAKSSMAFECLPIIENVEILRNILYSGVWSRFELKKQKRMEGKK